MPRAFYLCALSAFLIAPSAFATPIFTFTFNPVDYTVGQTDTVSLTATIDNTGTTDITGLSGFYTNFGTIGPYAPLGAFGTTGNASLGAEFAGIDLTPGNTFSFVFATLDIADAPVGSYTALADSAISLSDSSGGTPDISSVNEPVLDVVATPEPSAIALLGTGLLGLFGVKRRIGTA